jgi:hypothetical protein
VTVTNERCQCLSPSWRASASSAIYARTSCSRTHRTCSYFPTGTFSRSSLFTCPESQNVLDDHDTFVWTVISLALAIEQSSDETPALRVGKSKTTVSRFRVHDDSRRTVSN